MRTLYAATVALIEAGPMPAPLATAAWDAWHATMKAHGARVACRDMQRNGYPTPDFVCAYEFPDGSFTLAAR